MTEDFRAPFDSKRPVRVPRKHNFGSQNPVFNQNQSTGTTDAASGFKGDTNTKMSSPVFLLPKKKGFFKRRALRLRSS